uniref:MBD domain-containing protein n=1 Tax=Oryza meridionalis TaxID=40149 RepID=A0A0E0E8F2_9ORYZ
MLWIADELSAVISSHDETTPGCATHLCRLGPVNYIFARSRRELRPPLAPLYRCCQAHHRKSRPPCSSSSSWCDPRQAISGEPASPEAAALRSPRRLRRSPSPRAEQGEGAAAAVVVVCPATSAASPANLVQKPMGNSKTPQPSKKSRIMLSDTDGHQLDNDEFSSESASNQMVLFNPETVAKGQDELGENHSPSLQKSANNPNRGMPSIGAFTVQCAKCFKWRLIPTKEKYEEIRECIIQEPFECERAREWRPDVTCNDPEDISQDGSRLWAIDKPNIALPPPGWERQIRIRGEGGTKFADVYYTSPTGRKLRSLVEIDRYLLENPDYVAQGVTLTQFSFQIPRPLRQDYVKKRPKIVNLNDEASVVMTKSVKPEEVSPIAWAAPSVHQEGEAGERASHADEPPEAEELELTRKRKAESPLFEEAHSNHVSDEPKTKLEDTQNGGPSA